eukprot:gene16833-23114_t
MTTRRDRKSGAQIMVCEVHGVALCHSCCVDFTPENEEAISNAQNQKCASAPGQGLGKLKKNTKVICRDRSGRTPPNDLHGTITGSRMGKDEMDRPALCYVIKWDGDPELDRVLAEDVEDEFEIVQ